MFSEPPQPASKPAQDGHARSSALAVKWPLLATFLGCACLLTPLALGAEAIASNGNELEDERELLAQSKLLELVERLESRMPPESPDGPKGSPKIARRKERAALALEGSTAARRNADEALALRFATLALRLRPHSAKVAKAYAQVASANHELKAAAIALDTALARHPKDGELVLARATLLTVEKDYAGAIAMLTRLKGSVRWRLAERRIVVLQALQGETPATNEVDFKGQDADLRRALRPVESPADARVETASFRVLESEHFKIFYSAHNKDSAARARYEAKVQASLDDAWRRIAGLLQFKPERKIEVVLYTAEEFKLHFGGMGIQSVAGFYNRKIRMNGSETLDEEYDATLLHELTHAFLDDFCGAETPRLATWFNEGFATWTEWELRKGGERALMEDSRYTMVRELARSIGLKRISDGSLHSLGAETYAGYLKGRAAISVLIGTGGGIRRFKRLCEGMAEGKSFDQALREAFGNSIVDGLEEDANALLAK